METTNDQQQQTLAAVTSAAPLEDAPRDAAPAARASGGGRRLDYITFASVVCALSVVFLHTDNCYWTFSATRKYWWTGNIIDALFYFAVPVFFMITATTLMDFYQRYGLGEYFKKRAAKTLLPYLVWSLFGLAFRVLFLVKTDSYSLDASEVTLTYALNALGSGSCVSVYWFFPSLFSVYLSLPLFAAVPRERRRGLFTYLSVCGFILCGLKPFLVDVLDLPVTTSVTLGVGSGYLFFLPTGYLLSHYEVKPGVKWVLYALGLVGLVVHIVGTYVLSMEAGTVVRTYKGYTNLPSLLYSVAAFLLLKDVGTRLMQVGWLARAVNFLGRYTFAIYLLHWFVMKTLVQVFGLDIFSTAYRLFAFIPIVAISVGLAALLRKMPGLRRLVP